MRGRCLGRLRGIWGLLSEFPFRSSERGGGRADGGDSILVNNAGIADMRPFAMSTVEGVWRQVEVNFKGVSYKVSPLFS
jgi:NAD(P)-dependent dehydrogenase (short-subunit alcohol dehydrogenase family)